MGREIRVQRKGSKRVIHALRQIPQSAPGKHLPFALAVILHRAGIINVFQKGGFPVSLFTDDDCPVASVEGRGKPVDHDGKVPAVSYPYIV